MNKRMSRKMVPTAMRAKTPSEFPDAVTWAAWLYYVDEMTQSEVADAIGVSRVTVMKMLNEAKASGVVNVKINPRVVSHISTSRRLAEAFGLNSAMIIPDNPDVPLSERLGNAGAFALVDGLQPDDIVGVAWGRTVLSVAQNVKLEVPVDNLTVVSVSASPNGLSADFSPELCAALCANNLGARSVNLLAPAIVSSPELRAMLLQEPSIRKQLEVIRSANKVVFGVGELSAEATVRRSELFSAETVDKLADDGAAAVILGAFLDPDGQEMSGPTHDRTMGITLTELKAIPTRLCVAGGPGKHEAILATLKGGFATDLITDLSTATALLES